MGTELLTDPRTMAPVYFPGNLAAIPKTEFWYIPLAAKNKFKVFLNDTQTNSSFIFIIHFSTNYRL